MKSFKEYVVAESRLKGSKGWVNPKTKKAYTTSGSDPYHVQMIVMKPRDFGLTEKQILLVLEMQNEAMDAPDPEIWAKKDYKDLVSGDVDINMAVEYLAMKKGWYRVVGGKYGEIRGINVDDKVISECLNIMEDEGVIPADGEGVLSIACNEYLYKLNKDGPDVRFKRFKVLEGDAIKRALRGKTTGDKRTDIGRNMAMFRGEGAVEGCGCGCNEKCSEEEITEAEYQGKEVTLNEPFRTPGESKKFAVYTKNQSGTIVVVRFGDPNMEIRRDDPKARANFRSRHSCDDDPGPKWKARYWSCYQWREGAKVND